ncbi:MAG: hypothetical protein CMF62_03050 [Magnetococcales bacterium]|nr:hypothetical protein [Magnetococcales bacterium]|tara:strand:- start:22424 stop:22822 length:399 start_codon:yes stop_codon:yes gene_type:complete
MGCFLSSELLNVEDAPYFSFNNQIKKAKVVKVYDGDTIHVIFKHNSSYYKFKIRLYGINTPELKPPKNDKNRDKIIKNGKKARDRLTELILNKEIILECLDFDKYGRILGIIKLNNININQLMLDENLAIKY